MTSTQQRAALQRQIWQIANDVRGAIDGWDFKQYVLGTPRPPEIPDGRCRRPENPRHVRSVHIGVRYAHGLSGRLPA